MTNASVEHCLHAIVHDFFNFIVEEAEKGTIQSVPTLYERVSRHEIYDTLVAAIAHDSGLKKFFPELLIPSGYDTSVETLKKLQSVAIWSDGTSGGISILQLICGIIQWLFEDLWSRLDRPTIEGALSRLPRIVDSSRTLAGGGSVKVPAVVAIHNVGLGRKHAIQIGSSILRSPTRFDRSHLLGTRIGLDMDAALMFTTAFRRVHIRSLDFEYDRDEEHEKTLRLLNDRGVPAAEQQARRIRDSVDAARLAIVLASASNRFYAPFQSWSSALNPLMIPGSSGMSGLQGLRAPYPKLNIKASALQRIDANARSLEEAGRSIKVGGRRLLLAITERLYPEDGLVDAIICWESLFSGHPETMLRVCGSMARLLSPSRAAGRRDIYERLRNLYARRNNIVHGSGRESLETTSADRDTAIRYAIDAFKVILQRNDLLSIDDSSERGTRVLLGL